MENLIKSLGEPIDGNEYIIKPMNSEWWIEHKHVGSGEPLIQWLETELRQPPVICSFTMQDIILYYKDAKGYDFNSKVIDVLNGMVKDR